MKGRKTILIIVLAALMSFMISAASANPGGQITVALNNEKMEFASNEQPLVINGCTYLTLRTVTEKLGGEVEWDNKNQVVTMKVDGKTIMLSPGSEIYLINGKGFSYTSDAAILVDGRVRVPLRLVGEFLGVDVVWNAEERKIAITSNSGSKQVDMSSDVQILAAVSQEDSKPAEPDKSIPDDLDPKLKEILKTVDGVVCEYGTIYYSPKGNAGMYSPDNTILIRKAPRTYEMLITKYDENTKNTIKQMLVPFYPEQYNDTNNQVQKVIAGGKDFKSYYDSRYFLCFKRDYIAVIIGFDGTKY